MGLLETLTTLLSAILSFALYFFGIFDSWKAALPLLLLIFVTVIRISKRQFFRDLQLMLTLTKDPRNMFSTNNTKTSSDRVRPQHGTSTTTKPTGADVLSYLGRAFSQQRALVKGMAKNSMLLSGSHALNLWLPGSAFGDSPFNFYVPDSPSCHEGAKQTLEESGVVWDDELASEALTLTTKRPNQMPKKNITKGRTTFNGTSYRVQLISSPQKTPIDLILAFYASHLQCFISAFGAIHLYFPFDKRAVTWSGNTQTRASAEAELPKWEKRGFTFESKAKPRGQRDLRSLQDNVGAGKLKEFHWIFDLNIPKSLDSLRRQELRKLMWMETADRTYYVADAEVEELRRKWQQCRQHRTITNELVPYEPDGGIPNVFQLAARNYHQRMARNRQLGL